MSANLQNVVRKVRGDKVVNLENRSNNKNDIIPINYGCQILFQDATFEQIKDLSSPTDAYIIHYKLDGKICLDLCRSGKRVNIFDFYYDKYGKDSLQKIDFGYGRVSPRIWGYIAPEKKKRK